MADLCQPRLDDVADRDHAQQLAMAHHRHMAETAVGHGLHDVVDRVVGITGDDVAGHHMARFEIEGGGAVQRHGSHQIALGDNAGDLVVSAHHQHRADAPRGKLLGGSSSINGMVFVRGQSQDYDTWAQLGNRGWSYREVLPIFRDMESYQGEADDEYRGRGGLLKVTESNESGPLYDALIKAAGQVGINYTKDYNGASQDGIGMTQATIRNGRRMSTAVCYLDPARGRR